MLARAQLVQRHVIQALTVTITSPQPRELALRRLSTIFLSLLNPGKIHMLTKGTNCSSGSPPLNYISRHHSCCHVSTATTTVVGCRLACVGTVTHNRTLLYICSRYRWLENSRKSAGACQSVSLSCYNVVTLVSPGR